MRKLIHVPMIHSRQAMPQSDQIGQTLSSVAEIRSGQIESHTKTYWDIIREGLDAQNPQSSRFYIESTDISHVIKPGTQISPELGSKFPPDFEIIFDFISRVGGTIERTENLNHISDMYELFKDVGINWALLEEGMQLLCADSTEEEAARFNDYDIQLTEEEETILNQFLEARGSSLGATLRAADETIELIDAINDRRDEHIAEQISSTLQEGETGFLFLGAAHNVGRFLPPDIQTEIIDERLREIIDEVRDVSGENLENIMRNITFEGEGKGPLI